MPAWWPTRHLPAGNPVAHRATLPVPCEGGRGDGGDAPERPPRRASRSPPGDEVRWHRELPSPAHLGPVLGWRWGDATDVGGRAGRPGRRAGAGGRVAAPAASPGRRVVPRGAG